MAVSGDGRPCEACGQPQARVSGDPDVLDEECAQCDWTS